jgi:hypothetical protein
MQVSGAQFVPGALPAEADGPRVESLELQSNSIWPGYPSKQVKGSLDEGSAAAILFLVGDSGYWILPAAAPDVAAPALPTFRAVVSFSETLPQGSYQMETHSVDANGALGPPLFHELTAIARPGANRTPAVLAVTLTWDTESDLDLHVVDPLENEIYHAAPTSLDGFTPGAETSKSYGLLEADSNANCVIDGLRREQVTWSPSAPSGSYLVRVDAKSLCKEAIAHFSVEVSTLGRTLTTVSGVLLDADTAMPHDRGAGVLALRFNVP